MGRLTAWAEVAGAPAPLPRRGSRPVLLRPVEGWRRGAEGTGAPVDLTWASQGELVRVVAGAPDAAGQRSYRLDLTAASPARAAALAALALERVARSLEAGSASARVWAGELAEAMAEAPADDATPV